MVGVAAATDVVLPAELTGELPAGLQHQLEIEMEVRLFGFAENRLLGLLLGLESSVPGFLGLFDVLLVDSLVAGQFLAGVGVAGRAF